MNKLKYSQNYGFSSSHLWMWDLDHKEGWTLKNWRFQTVVLEKTLDWKEIKPVNPKGNQPWIFIGRTHVEAEAPTLGHLMRRADSLEKTLMLEKIEVRRRGQPEDKIFDRYHWLDGHEFEQAPGVGDGQVSLVCCSPWGHKSWTWLSN